jgi:hypothetical protein
MYLRMIRQMRELRRVYVRQVKHLDVILPVMTQNELQSSKSNWLLHGRQHNRQVTELKPLILN